MASGSTEGLNPVAALAAAAVPGAGYLVLKRPARALGAFAGIMLLFAGGLFIGGIDAVDSKEDKIWFYGQALVGPIALGIDYAHQNHFKAHDPDSNELRSGYPNETIATDAQGNRVWRELSDEEIAQGMGPPNKKGVGRMNEIGQLSCTLAGMMNLIVFLDALLPTVWTRREDGGNA